MDYSLTRGAIILARIRDVLPDMPWFEGRSEPTPAFDDLQPLFERDRTLLEAERWDEWEGLWNEVRELGVRLVPDDGSGEITDFALHLYGDHCRFRFGAN